MLVAAVSEGLPQCEDINGEVAFLDKSVRPKRAHQSIFIKYMTAVLDQQQEQIEQFRFERNGQTIAQQELLCNVEQEGAEFVEKPGWFAHARVRN